MSSVLRWFFFSSFFSATPAISRSFPHSCLLLSLVNTGCGSCGRCFSFCLYGLFRRTGEYRKRQPIFSRRRFNGLVLLVIGGRSNAYCACPTGLQYSVLPLNGCAASFTCAGHFLAFTSCFWITYCLQIYVVPFSNAKVVGSFRMARLNMFRRKVVA